MIKNISKRNIFLISSVLVLWAISFVFIIFFAKNFVRDFVYLPDNADVIAYDVCDKEGLRNTLYLLAGIEESTRNEIETDIAEISGRCHLVLKKLEGSMSVAVWNSDRQKYEYYGNCKNGQRSCRRCFSTI